jgi:extradiol dioxygenase family protein
MKQEGSTATSKIKKQKISSRHVIIALHTHIWQAQAKQILKQHIASARGFGELPIGTSVLH